MVEAESRAKPVIAVDLDEVLGQFLISLLAYYNEREKTAYKVEDFHSYRFCDVWGGTNEEATDLIYQFFETDYFKTGEGNCTPKGVPPLPGALQVLKEFSDRFDFYVVTSRQFVIIEETRKWLDVHYKGVFKDVLFGNHWAKEVISAESSASNPAKATTSVPSTDTTVTTADRETKPIKHTKSEMCKEINAVALIDDAPAYITDCLEKAGDQFKAGIIFGQYGWQKEASPTEDPRRKRCKDWTEVREELLELL